MTRKLIAMLLVAVMCFALMSMVAFAADDPSAAADDAVNINFDMFKKTFTLPPVISQLLDMFQLKDIWNSIMNVVKLFPDIDNLF